MKVFKPDRPWKLYLVVAVPLVLTVVLAVVLLSGGKNGPDAPVDTAPGSSETLIFNPSATLPPVTLDVAAGSNVSFTSSDVSEPTGSGSQPPETTTEPPVFNAPPLVYASTETLSGTESDNGATVLRYEIRYPVFAAADGSSAVCSVRVCSVIAGDGWTAHAVVGSRLRVMTSAMKSDTIRFFTPLFLLNTCIGSISDTASARASASGGSIAACRRQSTASGCAGSR